MSLELINKVADTLNYARIPNFAWGATAYRHYVPEDFGPFVNYKVIEWIVYDLDSATKALQDSGFEECPFGNLDEQWRKDCLVEHSKYVTYFPDHHLHAGGDVILNLYTNLVLSRTWPFPRPSVSSHLDIHYGYMVWGNLILYNVKILGLHQYIQSRLIALARTVFSHEDDNPVEVGEYWDYYITKIIEKYSTRDLESGLDRKFFICLSALSRGREPLLILYNYVKKLSEYVEEVGDHPI